MSYNCYNIIRIKVWVSGSEWYVDTRQNVGLLHSLL